MRSLAALLFVCAAMGGCSLAPLPASKNRTGIVVQREPWNEQGLSRGEGSAMAELAALYDRVYGHRTAAALRVERNGVLEATCAFVSSGRHCRPTVVTVEPGGFGTADFQRRVYRVLKNMTAGDDACEAGQVRYVVTFSTDVHYAMDSLGGAPCVVVPAMRGEPLR